MSKIRVNELDTESGSSIAIAEGKRITADLLYGNSQQVNVNFTVPATENTMSIGPIAINNGVTITIAPGGRWKIV
jgi:hypothetical protein